MRGWQRSAACVWREFFLQLSQRIKSHTTAAVALACSATLFGLMQPAQFSNQEKARLALQFQFNQIQLPQPNAGSMKTIRNVHPSLSKIAAFVSATGAAVALGDLDGDGKPNDIVLVDPRTDEVSVFPAPGTGDRFTKFTLTPHDLSYESARMAPMGALIADINEDGRAEVIVYYWGRTPVAFLRKAGRDTARRLYGQDFVAQELVPSKEIWNTSSAVVADFDGDGHQDLLFCNYFPDGAEVLNAKGQGTIQLQDSMSRAFNGGKKHLLRFTSATFGDKPSMFFVEQKHIFPEDVNRAWTIAVGAADLDGDMLPEIYLANDTGPDRLLHNRSRPGKPCFTVVEGQPGFTTPTSFVLGNDSFKGMGCDFCDLNNDGIPDIYVSNIACPGGLEESHFLWLSSGDRTSFSRGTAPYRQFSEELGLSRSGWGWDCRLDDFNNQGTMEAVQATGFLKGSINRWPELQALSTANSIMIPDARNWPRFGLGDDVSGDSPNCFFVRAQNGKYVDVAKEIGIATSKLTRGLAVGDIDADGRLDFVAANQWGPSYLYHNVSPHSGQFLSLRLLLPVDETGSALVVQDGAVPASHPASPAIGATATLHLPDNTTRTATIDGGTGHSGKRAQEIHFGLGNVSPQSPLRVDLKWRTRKGKMATNVISVSPGWHTVELATGGTK